MIRSTLDAARAALRGEPGPRVLSRTDHAPSVAFLVTLARTDGDLIVPLRAGENFVGRGHDGYRPYGTWPDPVAVEGAQWCIECGSDGALVWDAASTNLSVILPSTLAAEVPLGVGLHGFERLFDLPGALPLPHPNVASDRHRYPLAEGDVLRGCYAAFAFGWLREPS